MRGRVLVAGFATRHVVQSAARAGYEVCAIDHFTDIDLAWYATTVIHFEDLDELQAKVDRAAAAARFDFFVGTSGAELLCVPFPRKGTPPEVAEQFLDKLATQDHFSARGIPVPRLLNEGVFPAFLKPRSGSGGWRNQAVADEEEETAWRSQFPGVPMFRQEIVAGIPASVSLLSDGARAVPIATNQQILRGGTAAPWGFAGSITPLPCPGHIPEIAGQAQEALSEGGCRGSVGMDFVLGKDHAWGIEVNPRFQATLDTIELATGMNLFSLHVQACDGVLPGGMLGTRRVAARQILFASQDCTIRRDCSGLAPMVADIPAVGTQVEEGGAIISVFGTGPTAPAAQASLARTAHQVETLLGLQGCMEQ